MSGLIGPVQVIILSIIFLVLFITALVLILKKERDYLKIIWIVLIIIFPIIGSIIYILYYLLSKRE